MNLKLIKENTCYRIDMSKIKFFKVKVRHVCPFVQNASNHMVDYFYCVELVFGASYIINYHIRLPLQNQLEDLNRIAEYISDKIVFISKYKDNATIFDKTIVEWMVCPK